MAYQKPKDHKKQKLSDIVKKGESGGKLGSEYSVESLRANMSTGGGEPIPKGHKRTTERRVMQPRDPKTGQFEYNASAKLDLEYESRGKKIPIAARRLGISEKMVGHTGNVIMIDDKAWVSVNGNDVSADEVRDYFKEWHSGEGDFVNRGGEKFTGSFDRKRGRVGGKEKAAAASGQVIVDAHVEFGKAKERAKAMKPKVIGGKVVRGRLSEGSAQFQKNKKWNGFIDGVRKDVESAMGAEAGLKVLGGQVWKDLRGIDEGQWNKDGEAVKGVLRKHGLLKEGGVGEGGAKKAEAAQKEAKEEKSDTWDVEKGYGEELKGHASEKKDELEDF